MDPKQQPEPPESAAPASAAPSREQLESRLGALWGDSHWNDVRLHLDPKRVPLERPRRRWVLPVSIVAAVAVVALLGVFVLGGLLRGGGRPAPASTVTSTPVETLPALPDASTVDPRSLVVHDGDTVRVSGEVIATPGKGAVACPPYPDDLMQHSGPPTCSGPGVPLDGLSTVALTPLMSAVGGDDGVIVADEVVEGVWHNGRIQVTQQTHVDDTKGASRALGGNPPCAAPAGGWKSVAGNLDVTALQAYALAHKNSLTGIAIWRLADETGIAFAVAWGDPAVVTKALASEYPDQLCVVKSSYTLGDLAAVKKALMGGGISNILKASKAITWGPSFSKLGQRNFEIQSVSVSQDLADWASAQPAGIVDLEPWMRPVAASTSAPATAGAQIVDSLPALPDAASVAPDQLVVHDGDVVRLQGPVVIEKDGSARLCPDTGGGDSPAGFTPPDPCPGGLTLSDLDRSQLGYATGGVTEIQGVLHGSTVTVVFQLSHAAVERQFENPQDGAAHQPGCPTPEGGWKTGTSDLEMTHVWAYQSAHKSAIAGTRQFQLVGKEYIRMVTTWGDPAPVQAALDTAYPRGVCVIQSKFTQQQLSDAQNALQGDTTQEFGGGPTTIGFGGTGPDGEPVITVAPARVTQALASWVDGEPAGLVRLSPWLRPVRDVRYEGTVLDDGHGPQLCTVVFQTDPPQCSGTPVVGWKWSAVAGKQASGIHWAENAAFTGTPSPDGTKIVVDPGTEVSSPLG